MTSRPAKPPAKAATVPGTAPGTAAGTAAGQSSGGKPQFPLSSTYALSSVGSADRWSQCTARNAYGDLFASGSRVAGVNLDELCLEERVAHQDDDPRRITDMPPATQEALEAIGVHGLVGGQGSDYSQLEGRVASLESRSLRLEEFRGDVQSSVATLQGVVNVGTAEYHGLTRRVHALETIEGLERASRRTKSLHVYGFYFAVLLMLADKLLSSSWLSGVLNAITEVKPPT